MATLIAFSDSRAMVTKLGNLKQEISDGLQKISDLKRKIDELQVQNTYLKEQIAQGNSELTQQKLETDGLYYDNCVLREKVAQLTRNNSKNKDTISSLHKQLHELEHVARFYMLKFDSKAFSISQEELLNSVKV